MKRMIRCCTLSANFEGEAVAIPQGAEIIVKSGELTDGKVGKETTVWLKTA